MRSMRWPNKGHDVRDEGHTMVGRLRFVLYKEHFSLRQADSR